MQRPTLPARGPTAAQVTGTATATGAALTALAAGIEGIPSILWLAAAYAAGGSALTLAMRGTGQPLMRTLAVSAGLSYTATMLVAHIFTAGLALLPAAGPWLLALRRSPWQSEQANLVVGAGLLGGLAAGVVVVGLLPDFPL